MPDSSELHLIVPGICGPLAETQSLKSSHVLDRWIKTLSKSHSYPSQCNTSDVIAAIFKLKFENDFPSAAFSLMANNMYDPAMFYMHADPVHLRADLDQAVLSSSEDVNITDSEAAAICDMLNQHFDQDALNFVSLNKDQWFVSSRKKIKINATPLVDAIGRNINFILPVGEDSIRWKQVLTEAQMLMHSHELNIARESSGSMTIISLWFHGAGALANIENNNVTRLCSNHDRLKGLAGYINCDYSRLPDTVNEYPDYLLSCEKGTVNVLHLADIEHLVNYTDVRPWLNQLTETLDHWIYPLLKLAKRNNIKITLYPCNGKKYQFSKYDILKFWRKDKLESHVSSY